MTSKAPMIPDTKWMTLVKLSSPMLQEPSMTNTRSALAPLQTEERWRVRAEKSDEELKHNQPETNSLTLNDTQMLVRLLLAGCSQQHMRWLALLQTHKKLPVRTRDGLSGPEGAAAGGWGERWCLDAHLPRLAEWWAEGSALVGVSELESASPLQQKQTGKQLR